MKEWKEYLFKVNGFEMTAVYNEDTIQKVFLPLLKQLQQLQKEKKERIIVFMASYVILTPPARSNPSSILLARPIFFFVIPLVVINAPNTHKAISKISPAIYLPLLLRFFILRLPF